MQEQTTKQKKTNKITQVIKFGGGEKVAQSNLQIFMLFNRVRKKFSNEK